MSRMRMLLLLCGALAAGEYLASFVPECAELWSVTAGLAVFLALFGYGLGIRGWRYLFFAVLGFALYLQASVADEQLFREKPWMRGREWMMRRDSSPESGGVCEVKKDLSRRIGLGLEGERMTVTLSRAILLGERRRLPPQVKRMFVDSGTMHVFAISGLHVGAIAEVLAVLLAFLLVPRRFVGLAALPILWGYVCLIGAPPSAVRAAAMATFSGLAPLFWRKPDGLRSWALTFLLVHLLSPRMIVNVGNILSFAVMLAIVLVGRYVRDWVKWKQALTITFAAWAVGVPISARVFGRVTPGGMLANLVLIGVARVMVVAGSVGVLLSYLSEKLAVHLNNLSALFVRLMVLTADAVTRLPGSNFETGQWTMWSCILWYVALAALATVFVRWSKARQSL